MADLFLKLEDIEGESDDLVHGKAIEIRDWKWTTSNDAPLNMKQAQATEKAKVTGVQVTKWCDKASVTLTQYCAIGKLIPKGMVILRKKAGPNTWVEYLTVELFDVKINEVQWDVGHEKSLEETVKFNFAQFRLEYKIQDNDGTSRSSVLWGFDLTNHKEI